MFESYKDSEDDEDEDDLDSKTKNNRQKRLQKKASRNTENKDDADDEGDGSDKNRKASFFRKRNKDKTRQTDGTRTSEEDEAAQTDDAESANEKEEDDEHEGLTEAEAKEAILAIVDGLARELRNEFEGCEESTINELQTIAVAAFVDNLREKLEASDRDVTEELLDEALFETILDLLGIDAEEFDERYRTVPDNVIDITEVSAGVNVKNGAQANNQGNVNGNNGNGGNGSSGPTPSSASAPAAVAAFVAANKGTDDASENGKKRRGNGLLVGGIVGYIIGRRHGRMRAEENFQPEIDTLEDQVGRLYEAIAARELLIRQVVAELKSRQISGQEATRLSAESYSILYNSDAVDHSTSRAIKPPSLVVPVAFAALLVSHRLKADTSKERHTWGKDFLVGGTVGYMIGRRHGRKLAETQIKTDIEQLEYQVGSLNKDLVNRDVMVQAMMRVITTDDQENGVSTPDSNNQLDAQSPTTRLLDHDADVVEPSPTPNEQPKTELQKFVDDSIERIAVAKKNREQKRHKAELLCSGRAEVVGGFNLAGNVFLERRRIDGTENSSDRKQIEVMDEAELLAMSQNIYVDGESAIDLYNDGEVDVEVLRSAVIQFWRKTGDYEQTLRENLKRNNLVVDDIRSNLEKAYRSILSDAQFQPRSEV